MKAFVYLAIIAVGIVFIDTGRNNAHAIGSCGTEANCQSEPADVDASEKAIAHHSVHKASGAVDSLAWNVVGSELLVQTKPGAHARDKNRTVSIFDVAQGRWVQDLCKTKEPIFSVNATANGRYAGCVAWPESDPAVREPGNHGKPRVSELWMWDLATGKQTARLRGEVPSDSGVPCRSAFLCMAFSPDGKTVAAAGKLVDEEVLAGSHIGGEICVWDTETCKLKWSDRTTHTDIIYAVAYSPDGEILASAGIDKLIRLWDPRTGQLQRTLTGITWGGVASLGFSPDGKLLATGGDGREEGGTVRIWDLGTGRVKYTFTAAATRFAPGTATRVAFAPDGNTLFAVGSSTGNEPRLLVQTWNPLTGAETGILLERPGYARALAVSPDGTHLAIGTWEEEVVIVFLSD